MIDMNGNYTVEYYSKESCFDLRKTVIITIVYDPVTKSVTKKVSTEFGNDKPEAAAVISDLGIKRFFGNRAMIQEYVMMAEEEPEYYVLDGGEYRLKITTPEGEEREMSLQLLEDAPQPFLFFERYARKIRKQFINNNGASTATPL